MFELSEWASHSPFSIHYSLFTIYYSPFSFPYSYGDSTGLTPDFPFHPGNTGNQTVANVTCAQIQSGRVINRLCLSVQVARWTVPFVSSPAIIFLCSMYRERMLTILAHLAGWVLFFALMLGFLYNASPAMHFTGLLTNPWFVLFAVVFVSLYYINTLFLVPELYLKKHYFAYFTLIVLLLAGMYFFKPFDHVMGAFIETGNRPAPPDMGMPMPDAEMGPMPPPRNTGQQGFKVDIVSIILLVMVISLGFALRLIREWRYTEQRALRAENEKTYAELSFLKAQINPHFLFNTLNNIYSMVMVQHEHAADAVMKLSNIMRYITDEIRTDLVPLENEISCMQDYIDLQRLRLAAKTAVHVSISGDTGQQQIAPLLLMTFVENAFKYGVSNHEAAEIIIRLEAAGPMIRFSCVNKLFPAKTHTERSGIGIHNARKRLEYLYPGRFKLDINNTNGEYAVTLLLQS